MKLTLFALLAGYASAFAPATTKVGTLSALKAAGVPSFEDEPGALSPLGYWDPLGLATSREKFDFYRSVELKHGRVAMLAVVGYVVAEFYRFGYSFTLDGSITTDNVRNGVGAFFDIPPLGWVQMIFLVGIIDQTGFLADFDVVSLLSKCA